MRYFHILFTIVFGPFYWLSSTMYTKVQKWHFGMKKKDKVIWYLFSPFYWIIVIINYMITIPYEFLVAKMSMLH